MTKTAEQIFEKLQLQPRVFISCPYTKPDPCVNIHKAVKLFNLLLKEGKCFPVCLLWTHFFHIIIPRDYESWLAYCMVELRKCDCVLVMKGESSGKQREIQLALDYGKPVFHDRKELYKWIRREWNG